MGTFKTRRRFPRAPFRSPVGVLLSGEYRVVSGHELGEGGMSFIYKSPIGLAQRLLVTIPNSKKNFYCIQSEVRNCLTQPDGQFIIGIQFLVVSFEVKRDIRSLVFSIY
jgi:hypothetical protein